MGKILIQQLPFLMSPQWLKCSCLISIYPRIWCYQLPTDKNFTYLRQGENGCHHFLAKIMAEIENTLKIMEVIKKKILKVVSWPFGICLVKGLKKAGLARHTALDREMNPPRDEGCLVVRCRLLQVLQRLGYAPYQESQESQILWDPGSWRRPLICSVF